jgi:uncharacterized membrane protein YeaQ/YmgE (transglycosylase-associated protein family)
MLVIEIASWIIVGLVLGGALKHFSSTAGVRVPGALVLGTIGALLCGFLFRGFIAQGGYSVVALLSSAVGAIVVLFIDWSAAVRRNRRQPPPQQPQPRPS